MTGQAPGLTRHRERRSQDRAALEALLDEVWVGTLSTVDDAGLPWAVPVLMVRDGDRVVVHGSTGAGALRHAAEGAPVVLSVFLQDSLVLARSTFGHSADYRSATLRGRMQALPEHEKARAAALVTDGLIPGRAAEVPAATDRELAATVFLALPIEEDNWLLKIRGHGYLEDGADRVDDDPTWAGVIPVRRTLGEPQAAPGNTPGLPEPDSVRRLVGRDRAR